ncbi:hypothetical protein F164LOC_18335 [Pectobacterium carotovorum]|uniref:hypothetical protein n=1 Tax=Pectobacterium versatile TaxID=2488639 RepID=UPI000C7ECD70|nr:hypothetical protein [Pectobacterium versatile]PLY35852.1 hypothetical protein F164LOC_18335 [Pectobacterium carotovorum]
MKFISDDEYHEALKYFSDTLNLSDDIYDSEDISAIKKFEKSLDICIAYENQCYGQRLNKSLISSYMASKPKRAAFPIKSIY